MSRIECLVSLTIAKSFTMINMLVGLSWFIGEASSAFRKAVPTKFGKLVTSLGLDHEEGFGLTLHKLVENGSHSPDEPEARQNQPINSLSCGVTSGGSQWGSVETTPRAEPLHE